MSSLSDSDIETLQSIGENIIQTTVALVVEAVLWTIYLVLVGMAAKVLIWKRRSISCAITLLIIVTMFLMDTTMFFLDVNNALKTVSWTLTSNSDLSLSDRYASTDKLPYSVESALYAFMSNLGDVIVIWRAYAFYAQERVRWVLIIPVAFLVGSFAASGLISFCVAVHAANEVAAGNFVHPPFCKNVQLASYCTALATTGIATLLIAWKTWQYRRTIGRHLHETSSSKTRMERIAAILIESGVLYFLFFLEAVVSDSGNVGDLETSTMGLSFADTIWTYMSSHILGIYPAIIVILVHSQRSYIETVATGPSTHPSSKSSRRLWGTSNSSSAVHKVAMQPIEIDVHELRAVHGSAEWQKATRTTDIDGDEGSVLERGQTFVKGTDTGRAVA